MSDSKSDFEGLFGSANQPSPTLGAGDIAEGTVELIDPDAGEVVLRMADGSTGRISVSECLPENIAVGDKLLVLILKQAASNQNCSWILASRIARRITAWNQIVKSHETSAPLRWKLVRKAFGGWEIEIDGVRGYWPSADSGRQLSPGAELELTVISFDQQVQTVTALQPRQLQALRKKI